MLYARHSLDYCSQRFLAFYILCQHILTNVPLCALSTQASLGEQVQDGRTQLMLGSNGQKFVIASLLPNKSEHAVMELMFEAGTIEFSVAGKNEVHLAGNMMQEMDEDDMDDDDEDIDDDDEDDDEEDAPPPIKGGPKGGKPGAPAGKKVQLKVEEDEVSTIHFIQTFFIVLPPSNYFQHHAFWNIRGARNML
jgi:hypothetical protein